MARRAILGLVLACLMSGMVSAGAFDHEFDRGNQLFADGDFAGAVIEYEKIVQAGYESPELYYNLGNAYFRNGLLGQAIANYIRARRLAPRDDDILANLEFARQFAIDKIEVTEETIFFNYINRFFNSFSVNEITVWTFIVYVLTIAVVLARYIYRRFYIYTPVVVVLIVLLGITTILTGVKLDRDILTRTGVILNQQAEVKNGPGVDFTKQFTAHAGLIFKIEREESGYYLVNFENRLKGWIEKVAVVEI